VLVYFDPPYESGLYWPVMHLLGEKGLVSIGGTVVCEHYSKLDLLPAYGQLTHYRDVKQGALRSASTFYPNTHLGTAITPLNSLGAKCPQNKFIIIESF